MLISPGVRSSSLLFRLLKTQFDLASAQEIKAQIKHPEYTDHTLQLILEEFGCEFHHAPSKINNIVDTLSCFGTNLPKEPNEIEENFWIRTFLVC